MENRRTDPSIHRLGVVGSGGRTSTSSHSTFETITHGTSWWGRDRCNDRRGCTENNTGREKRITKRCYKKDGRRNNARERAAPSRTRFVGEHPRTKTPHLRPSNASEKVQKNEDVFVHFWKIRVARELALQSCLSTVPQHLTRRLFFRRLVLPTRGPSLLTLSSVSPTSSRRLVDVHLRLKS